MKDEKKAVAQTEKETINKTQKVKQPPKKSKGVGFALFFAFLLFAITAGALAFAYTWYNPILSKTDKQLTELTNQLATLKQSNQQAFLTQQLKQLQTDFNQLTLQNTQLQAKNKTALNKINQQIFLNKQNWLYSDIHYLLKLAVRRVDLVGDSKGAISALEAADDEIRKIENSALLDIRKSIFKTIKQLQAVQEPDTEGLILKVNYIKSLIINNTTKAKVAKTTTPQKPAVKTKESEQTTDIKQTVIKFLGQFFTIKNAIDVAPKNDKKLSVLPQKNKLMSVQVNNLLIIEKIKRAVLTMNQSSFNHYSKRLLDSLNSSSNILLKNEVQKLSANNVGIALPRANLPLMQYEKYLEKLQENNNGDDK